MAHYAAGRYQDAIPDLRLAAENASRAPEHGFYLGVSYLLAGDTGLAIDRLNAVAALGDTAYLEEARFFTAIALVRTRDLRGAQRQLDEVIRLAGDREREARNLREKLRAIDSSTPP